MLQSDLQPGDTATPIISLISFLNKQSTARKVGFLVLTAAIISTIALLSAYANPSNPAFNHYEIEASSTQGNTQPVANETTSEITQKTESTASTDSKTGPKSNVSATVNGERIEPPANGTITKTINSGDGSVTNMTVTSTQSNAGSSSNANSFTTNFQTSNSTSILSSTNVNTSTQFSSGSR